MATDEPVDCPVKPVKRTRASKPKVRSGCITCKIRRIKCDEAKPDCNRCISTGRTCDGYGKVQKQSAASTALQIRRKPTDWPIQPIQPAIYVGFPGGSQERRIFHRFRDQTVPAFTGCFHSQFWENLVLRVGHQERSVYHAIVALGAIHEEYQLNGAIWNGSSIQKPLYRQALQQYSSALQQLNDRLQQKHYSNVEIVLISCILFICFEILQGNSMAALSHFEGGMSVLRDLVSRQAQTNSSSSSSSIISSGELAELYHVFSRYDIQVCTFQATRSTQLTIPLMGRVMSNLSEAQCYVFALFNAMYQFVREEALPYKYANADDVPRHLITRKEHILESFHHWSTSLDRLAEEEKLPITVRDKKDLVMLKAQEKVAVISLKTSLACPTESNFDFYETEFNEIIQLAESFASISSELKEPWHTFTMELGIVQPLYYVATKCRHPSIRRRALQLLRETGTEGVWDGPIVSLVAKRVMEIEEEGLKPGQIIPETARFHTVDLSIDHEQRLVTMRAFRPKGTEAQEWEKVGACISF